MDSLSRRINCFGTCTTGIFPFRFGRQAIKNIQFYYKAILQYIASAVRLILQAGKPPSLPIPCRNVNVGNCGAGNGVNSILSFKFFIRKRRYIHHQSCFMRTHPKALIRTRCCGVSSFSFACLYQGFHHKWACRNRYHCKFGFGSLNSLSYFSKALSDGFWA